MATAFMMSNGAPIGVATHGEVETITWRAKIAVISARKTQEGGAFEVELGEIKLQQSLTTILRPGKTPSGKEVRGDLRRIIRRVHTYRLVWGFGVNSKDLSKRARLRDKPTVARNTGRDTTFARTIAIGANEPLANGWS